MNTGYNRAAIIRIQKQVLTPQTWLFFVCRPEIIISNSLFTQSLTVNADGIIDNYHKSFNHTSILINNCLLFCRVLEKATNFTLKKCLDSPSLNLMIEGVAEL